jgi:hypothetical protein
MRLRPTDHLNSRWHTIRFALNGCDFAADVGGLAFLGEFLHFVRDYGSALSSLYQRAGRFNGIQHAEWASLLDATFGEHFDQGLGPVQQVMRDEPHGRAERGVVES